MMDGSQTGSKTQVGESDKQNRKKGAKKISFLRAE